MPKTNRLVGLFFLVATVLTLPTIHASAALVRCRTDPIFKLSNGDVINVSLEISTDASNVKSIAYVLHIPSEVTVIQVIYTAAVIKKGMDETYQVYEDSPTQSYTTDTVVTTQSPDSIEVSVFTRLNGVSTETASGYSGEHLVATVNRP